MLVDFLNGAEALGASTDDLRRFIADLLRHRSLATAAARYRVTAAVLRLGGPRRACAVQDLRKLLIACVGRYSRPRRDTALIRRMPEPGGMHRAEVIRLTVGSMDLNSDVAAGTAEAPPAPRTSPRINWQSPG